MIDAISKLVESGAISEDVQKSISEAWDLKVKENREGVSAELREEFAKRYEHDKANMVEAIDKMMTETLKETKGSTVSNSQQNIRIVVVF